MKIVCSSDWHGDATTLGVRRFDEVVAAVEQSVEHAIAIGAEWYLFLGDLCDPDSGGDTFSTIALALRTATRLAQHRISSVWVAGNHDVCEDGTGATTLTPLRALETTPGYIFVAEVPRMIWLRDSDLALLALPFAAVSRGYDPAKSATQLWPTDSGPAHVVTASHLSLPGIHPGSETEDMPRGREVVYPFEATKRAALRLQGHYHQRQVYAAPAGPPVHVVGSLARLKFGEQEHDPGFLVVDV